MNMKEKAKPHNCNTCTENKNGYCKLRINQKPKDSAKCENILECGFYREVVTNRNTPQNPPTK